MELDAKLYVQFCSDLRQGSGNWTVTNWSRAVLVAFGPRGCFVFWASALSLLLPSLALTMYSWHSGRPVLLIWIALSLFGFWTMSTNPTGIGMLSSASVALVGFVFCITQSDWLFLALGLMPGVTWFVGCAILGMTASYLGDALQQSTELFQNFRDRGLLKGPRVEANVEASS